MNQDSVFGTLFQNYGLFPPTLILIISIVILNYYIFFIEIIIEKNPLNSIAKKAPNLMKFNLLGIFLLSKTTKKSSYRALHEFLLRIGGMQ